MDCCLFVVLHTLLPQLFEKKDGSLLSFEVHGSPNSEMQLNSWSSLYVQGGHRGSLSCSKSCSYEAYLHREDAEHHLSAMGPTNSLQGKKNGLIFWIAYAGDVRLPTFE
jgi:hypothetical protein